MALAPPPMELVNDIHFLRQDNENLLNEVMSLRQQSTLLRDRSDGLERKLRECLARRQTQQACHRVQPPPFSAIDPPKPTQRHSNVLDLTVHRKHAPQLRLDIPAAHDLRSAIKLESPEVAAVWFDDPTDQDPEQPPPGQLWHKELHPAGSGSQLIGEAPRAAPDQRVEPGSLHRPSTLTPPSPDPSERQSRIVLPSLRSVKPPVQSVAVPNVMTSLLELRLIQKETYDTPAAVASFLQKLTQTDHTTHSTYRSAFTAAFMVLIPLLGPPGTLSAEWLGFLHDVPSRIPHTQRDSIVSIPWPESYSSHHDISPSALLPPAKRSSNPYSARRRSQSLDGMHPRPSPIRNSRISDIPRATDDGAQRRASGAQTGERDAWVLLLALAFAALPSSRVAMKLRRLPITVRLQMIAWLPPGVNVYANLQFASTTVDDTLGQFWDAKKEILRLKHGWP